jgi:hypothetical protein
MKKTKKNISLAIAFFIVFGFFVSFDYALAGTCNQVASTEVGIICQTNQQCVDAGQGDKCSTDTSSKKSDIIPDCALDKNVKDNYCKDVSSLVELAINVGQFLFSIIGGLAFVMFIYGGFKMILSFGNAEKFKEGRNILVAAVIGLAIAFGAYMLIDFILDALTVGEGFREVK